MANFFTRLTERSLGLNPVVQPAIASRYGVTRSVETIAPRFSFTSAQVDGGSPAQLTELQTNAPEINTNQTHKFQHNAERSSLQRSFDVPLAQSISLVNEPQSTPEPNSAIKPPQAQTQTQTHTLSFPNQSLQASPSSIPHSKQSIPSGVNPIVPTPSIAVTSKAVTSKAVTSKQVADLKPFRVLHPPQEDSSGTIAPAAISTSSFSPSFSSPFSSQSPPIQVSGSQVSDKNDRSTENRAALSVQLAAQSNSGATVPLSEVSQASADRAALPATIRVSIGRVEVRAVLPTPPPPPKAAPAPPRPAVSLHDYLKQRGGKP